MSELTPADIAVVIPALNEQANIAAAIRSALDAGTREVIVSDGGSSDATIEMARQAGVTKLVRSLPGRGIQLNSGAVVADRDWLLFLHADNRLHPDCLRQICAQTDPVWGAFRQRIESPRKIFRAIEWGNALRVQTRRMAFGDQAIFVRRDLFRSQGGFAEVPLMEDVELSRRLRKIARPALLDGPVWVDPRRWQRRGVLRQTLRNWSIQLAYAGGTHPNELRRRYER